MSGGEDRRHLDGEGQKLPESSHESESACSSQKETKKGSSRQPKEKQNSSQNKKRGYFSSFKNWVNFATLIVVSIYTIVTIGILIATRDFGQRQLRAYVSSQTVADVMVPGKDMVLITIAKNVGQNPALDLVGTINFTFSPSLPRDSELEQIGDNYHSITKSDSLFQSGNPTSISLTSKWYPQPFQLRTMKGGGVGKLYIWGVISYKDVFTCRHFLRYCVYLAGTALGSVPCDGERTPRNDDPAYCNK